MFDDYVHFKGIVRVFDEVREQEIRLTGTTLRHYRVITELLVIKKYYSL